MQKQLESMNIELESSELQRFPNNTKSLDLEDAKLVLKLIDKLGKLFAIDTFSIVP
ncbi:hypothetical protein N9Y89_00875 [bacterium]|nr:hypothetical protein [bacterium]